MDSNLEKEELKKTIEENPLALATVNPDGTPNVIGVACVKVAGPDKLLVTDNYMKKTNENISEKGDVCLAVWNSDWKGYKLSGKAEYFSQGKWKEMAEKIPENKGLPAKGAVLITVSEVIKIG